MLIKVVAPPARDVLSHVTRAADFELLVRDLNYGDRRFGRNALHDSALVLIKHDIPDDEHLGSDHARGVGKRGSRAGPSRSHAPEQDSDAFPLLGRGIAEYDPALGFRSGTGDLEVVTRTQILGQTLDVQRKSFLFEPLSRVEAWLFLNFLTSSSVARTVSSLVWTIRPRTP